MATCRDIALASYPEQHTGTGITALEGISLLPVLKGAELNTDRAIFWEHEGNRAVRKGKWKLVATREGNWELYDIEADRTEMNDLVQTHPDIAAELTATYDAWAKRCNVVP